MDNQKNSFLSILMFVVDMLLSISGIIIGGYIFRGDIFPEGDLHRYILVFLAFLTFFFMMYDLYQTSTDEVFGAAVSTSFSTLFSTICTFIVAFALRWKLFSLPVWIVASLITWALLVTWRTTIAMLIKKFGRKKKCLIIENMNNTSRLARKLKYASNEGRESFYYLIDEENSDEIEILLNKKLREYDLIIITPAVSKDISERIMQKAFMLGKDVSVLADLGNVSTLKGKIRQLDDTPVIEKKNVNINIFRRIVKRCFDIVFALIMGIVFSPAFLICAVMIKLDSKGPVIYKQERYTINKKIFTIYKFRTMVQDAEKDGAKIAEKDDPRVTKVGKILRATRLDELPQIINVFMGSMSVVGPRPERPIFADEFSKTVKNYDIRFCVKAGITGYAHVYGKYNTRMSDRILMDTIYIVNYSILTDIKIILLTGKIMLLKSAAEGIDEDLDKELSSSEREEERRRITVREMGVKDDSINYHTGV